MPAKLPVATLFEPVGSLSRLPTAIQSGPNSSSAPGVAHHHCSVEFIVLILLLIALTSRCRVACTVDQIRSEAAI
eukprot:3829445-Prymnesium_polylepis.1